MFIWLLLVELAAGFPADVVDWKEDFVAPPREGGATAAPIGVMELKIGATETFPALLPALVPPEPEPGELSTARLPIGGNKETPLEGAIKSRFSSSSAMFS